MPALMPSAAPIDEAVRPHLLPSRNLKQSRR
jgi:hypothetical protein